MVYSCPHLCEAVKWCRSSFLAVDLFFCQNFIHPHFHSLELLVRHRFCEFIRASVRTCAFAWFWTHCDMFLNLLADACIYIYIYMYVYTYICIYIWMCICVYMYVYVYIYSNVCICMCIYICMCLYIACMCSLFHLALGNKDGGVQLVYESACCLAWGVIFDRRMPLRCLFYDTQNIYFCFLC